MGRPKKFKDGTTNMSYSIPNEIKDDTTKKLDELAVMESMSRSEVIVKALVEYIENHYPGNPQLTLSSVTGMTPLPKLLQMRQLNEELNLTIKEIARTKGKQHLMRYYRSQREKLKTLTIKASKFVEQYSNKELKETLDEALKIW